MPQLCVNSTVPGCQIDIKHAPHRTHVKVFSSGNVRGQIRSDSARKRAPRPDLLHPAATAYAGLYARGVYSHKLKCSVIFVQSRGIPLPEITSRSYGQQPQLGATEMRICEAAAASPRRPGTHSRVRWARFDAYCTGSSYRFCAGRSGAGFTRTTVPSYDIYHGDCRCSKITNNVDRVDTRTYEASAYGFSIKVEPACSPDDPFTHMPFWKARKPAHKGITHLLEGPPGSFFRIDGDIGVSAVADEVDAKLVLIEMKLLHHPE